MEDRAEELKRMIEQFDAEHDQWVKRIRLAIGRFLSRIGRNPLGRFIIANFTTRLAAYLIVRFRILGIEKGGDMIDVAYQWHKLGTFLKVPAEVESATPDRVVITHSECTMGFTTRDAKVCRASMNMDREIIRQLGGKLTVEQTIAAGAPKCRHIIERATPAHGK